MQEGEPFIFEGKEVVDYTILFYWSTVSISRALRFNAEAQHQKGGSYVLATVAGYYSLFHLGMFLLYSAPHLMDADLRGKINEGMRGGRRDPRRVVKHGPLGTFLKSCHKHGLPAMVVDLFGVAQALRVFVNYGPDLQTTPQGFRVFNLSHHTREADDVLGRIDGAFMAAVEWASQTESDSKLLVPVALSKAAAYFLPNEDGDPYYSEWSSPEVLSGAEVLRSVLEARSQELVYPN